MRFLCLFVCLLGPDFPLRNACCRWQVFTLAYACYSFNTKPCNVPWKDSHELTPNVESLNNSCLKRTNGGCSVVVFWLLSDWACLCSWFRQKQTIMHVSSLFILGEPQRYRTKCHNLAPPPPNPYEFLKELKSMITLWCCLWSCIVSFWNSSEINRNKDVNLKCRIKCVRAKYIAP